MSNPCRPSSQPCGLALAAWWFSGRHLSRKPWQKTVLLPQTQSHAPADRAWTKLTYCLFRYWWQSPPVCS